MTLNMKSFFLAIDKMHRTVRFLIALVLGLIVFLLLQRPHGGGLAYLYGWICFAGTSLFFSWVTILTRQPEQTGVIAREQDSSALLIFLLVVTAAFVSLFAIILLLKALPEGAKVQLSLHIVLSAVSIVLSWLLVHSLFTIRYAHLYYDFSKEDSPESECTGGLVFPGKDDQPDFLDFAYFSFIIAMTFQTADVNITGRHIRRLALLHGLFSFAYNTTIIALVINIVSGLIGNK